MKITANTAGRAQYLQPLTTANTKQRAAWADYGYPEQIDFPMLYQMHDRNGIAAAGNQIPPEICWRTNPMIYQGKEAPEAPSSWDNAVADVFDRTELFYALYCADDFQRVGRYGALLVQIAGSAEQANWSTPLANIGLQNIVRFIPAYEGQLKPSKWDEDRSSPRYGLPLVYQYDEQAAPNDLDRTNPRQFVDVHWSRVLIFAEGAPVGSIYGVPANRKGFNDLLTMELIVGAGGQGFWRNAASKIHFDLDAEANITKDVIDAQKNMIRDFVEGFDKQLVTGGMQSHMLQTNLTSPEHFFKIALQSYSASVRIPANRLVGSVTGVLAGDKDDKAFMEAMQSRRQNFCVRMVNQVVDWLVAHGVVPSVDRYTVEFDDLLAPSDDDKLGLAEKMARINQVNAAAGPIFSAEEIRMVSGYKGPAPDDIEPEMLIDDEESDT